jgi:translocation and assembly module TamB
MSESESTPSGPAGTPEPGTPQQAAPETAGLEPISQPEEPSEPARKARPSRLRRFFLLHLPLTVACAAAFLAVSLVGLYFFASSARFENFVREQMVRQLETATGGRVEIASFHWNLLHLEAEADGVVIHGLEGPGEAPYAQLGRLRVRLSLLGLFWSPRIRLHELEIFQPRLHLIVYPDGSTNQPRPRMPRKPGQPLTDRLFDLKAGQIVVEQGDLDNENRAAVFDFQNRHIPLDFSASDVSMRMVYLPATNPGRTEGHPEGYRIEIGARDLNLARGASSPPGTAQPLPVHGFLQATLDLTRTAVTLQSLRITARSRGVPDRTVEVSGTLSDFAHPRWKARTAGVLDLRLIDPITGYPCAPEGTARLDLAGAGEAGSFRVDGSVHVEGGSYIGTGVVATGVSLDARVHADPEQLVISSIVARLRQGGQIDGQVALSPWLPALPGASTLQPAGAASGKPRSTRSWRSVFVKPQPVAKPHPIAKPPRPSNGIIMPVNGKVTASLTGVALDTLLEMVSEPPFQHLGFDARISGPATAIWTGGDVRTLSVGALLKLTPPSRTAPGTVPASGMVDGTYTQRNGAVDLRTLKLDLPSSQVQARGHLGAYPLASPSALAVDFHTRNLGEFDTVLRDLGLTCKRDSGVGGDSASSTGCKSSSSALPVALSGQADFHGSWTGSLVDPHLAGNLQATRLAVELPALSTVNSGQPQFVRFDSIEATGSYSAARIEVSRGLLRRDGTEIALDGTLDARTHRGQAPSINANSLLHLRLRASQVGMSDVRLFTARILPVAGALNAQLQLDGPLHTLNGSGWVEMDKGSVYGEPVDHIRAQGTLANQEINLTSVAINEAAGRIAATGSYNLQTRRFELNAQGAGIDASRIEILRRRGLAVSGKLGFTAQGAGTFDDPLLQVDATLAGLTVNGEPLGSLGMAAHTANRLVTYDVSTRLETARLTLHGQTALTGDHATQAKLDFPRLNLGKLFNLANVQGISDESALTGTITLDGPLARPAEMRGEARLGQLAATVTGVHLHSAGGVHATLDHAVIRLDRLHVTGEDTDLDAQGSLSLQGDRQLDLTASGSVNLKVAETLDPDLTAGGSATLQVEAHGPLMNPSLRGRIDFQNGSLALEDLANGLSQLHGTLEFNQNRLEVKSLTAMTGGGQLTVGGYLAYQHGVFADLTATGTGIRIRYPQGISSLADASLRLQGQRNNLLLSGKVLITRFTVSPDLDVTALTAKASAVESIAPPNTASNHVRLDVRITSSPQLNFQNAYAKLAGNVDLHLRGTVASPSLLGRISITEGSALVAGTRYELQRGEVAFTNPIRIQPNIDLIATAHVEDYDITLSLHGIPENLAVSYRSDPPLPEADVVALLALGRTESQQRLYTQQQEQSGANPTTEALLGGALNATVSSRVQRLFGAGSVKVDPNYLGALGNSTTRVIVEEQLGRNVTLTFATDVDTTSQQLIQADVAINHHVSLQVARDESGVFSMVLKATRRYR